MRSPATASGWAVFASASEVDAAASRQRDLDFFRDLAKAGTPVSIADVSLSRASSQRDRLLGTALMSRMPPVLPGGSGERPIGLRRVTHGLDLGAWFTQPAVIVLGIVRAGPDVTLPMPLTIETGEDTWQELRGDALVVVRWVYTLEASPPDATPAEGDEAG